MISLRLASQDEVLAQENPYPQAFGGGQRPLAHQVRTAAALRAGHEVVVNTHNTGTGKTKAALLHLHELVKRPVEQSHALLIAPTNELIAQHARDAEVFVRDSALDYTVQRMTAPALHAAATAEDTPAHRRQATAQLRAWLEAPTRTLTITNPDIFYYALFFEYGRVPQRDLFRKMFSRFWYVIVDEFHYYNPKQLVCFLFFLALSKAWGYIADGRQILLLSATPSQQVRTYLGRLGLTVTSIAPDERADSSARSTPALAPLDLHLLSTEDRQGLLSLVQEQRDVIRQRVHAGQQGAGISSALWRVNHAYALLRGTAIGPRVARLTGPEPTASRAAAATYDMLLATPTVDIGYNFERISKSRQSIDFLLCDARSADELVQRLGRAGRVLGKRDTDLPSTAWATVPPEVLKALDKYAGGTLDRPTFNTELGTAMPPRFSEATYAYLDSGGIVEVFKPLYGISQMGEASQEGQIRDIYELIRTVMAPKSKRTYEQLAQQTRTYLAYDGIFTDFPNDDALRGRLSDRQQERVNEAIGRFRRQTSSMNWPEFMQWLGKQRENHAVTRARFSFRESFDPPAAVICDRQHDLSSNDILRYDALHVVQNYEAEWFDQLADWRATLPAVLASFRPEPEDRLFCVLTRMRPPEQRPIVRFRLHQGDMTRSDWEDRYCYQEAAACDLHLDAEGVPLPPVLIRAFRDQYVPFFAARTETPLAGMLRQLCRSEGWMGRDLEVTFADGTARNYLVVMGTAMFFAAARLHSASMAQRRADASQDPGWIL